MAPIALPGALGLPRPFDGTLVPAAQELEGWVRAATLVAPWSTWPLIVLFQLLVPELRPIGLLVAHAAR
eukprot:15371081-Alexandrium_andersonii.AAC.1